MDVLTSGLVRHYGPGLRVEIYARFPYRMDPKNRFQGNAKRYIGCQSRFSNLMSAFLLQAAIEPKYDRTAGLGTWIGVGNGDRHPLPPNPLCSFPATGSPVSCFRIGIGAPMRGLWTS